MLMITLRDLAFRSRQFVIAVVGAALVFAIGLLLAGMAASYQAEVHRVVERFRADAWIVPAGSSGPFTSFGPLSPAELAAAVTLPGIGRADPVIIVDESAQAGSVTTGIIVVGHVAGGL